MPGLPFDILASSVMTGQQTKSTIQEDSGGESIFSQNLELALQSVLSEKELKNGGLMQNEAATEAIKTLDSLNFVDLTKFASLILEFEEELTELANVKGLSVEEEEILKLAFWQGLMQMMNDQPELPNKFKIQSFINNFIENKDIIIEKGETTPLQQLQSMVKNIGKKQYFSEAGSQTEDLKSNGEGSVKIVSESEAKNEIHIVNNEKSQKPFIKESDKTNIEKVETNEKASVNSDAIQKLDKPEKVVAEQPQLQKEGSIVGQKIENQKVIHPIAVNNSDQDMKLKEVEDFRNRFISKVKKDVIEVASKNQDKIPPQLLKLINKVHHTMSQLNQKMNVAAMADLQRNSKGLSVKINSSLAVQSVEKNVIAKTAQPLEIELDHSKQAKIENGETADKDSHKEKIETDKTDKYKIKPKLARAYTPARPIQQASNQTFDILSKYNAFQSNDVESIIRPDFSASTDDASHRESQPMKVQKTVEVPFEAQRQPTEVSKPEMSDAPKFNSDPTRTAKLMQSVKEQMRLWVDKKYTAMKVQVEPAELGKIQLKTVVEQGKIGVLLQAESSIAKEILSHNISQMKEMLESMGLNVATFTVADWDESGFRNANQQNKSSAKFDMKSLMEEIEPENEVQNYNHGLINRVA